MQAKVVIHVGSRKAGSSALQELLADQTDLLHSLNIDYPDRLSEFPAHQELANSLMVPRPEYFRSQLSRDEIYNHFCSVIDRNIEVNRTTLLSSEDLSLLTFDFNAMEYIKCRFGKYQPKIVFFERDPLDYHISNYKHSVMFGREVRTFSEYLFNIENLLYAHSLPIIKVWQSVFGLESVVRIKYNMERFSRESILYCFLNDVFNVQILDTFLEFKRNVGFPTSALNLVLQLNRSTLDRELIERVKGVINSQISSANEEKFLETFLTEFELDLIRRIYFS